ncbi:hypothetical protein J4221_06990 [Candidatus Pacearchaeota archaeon]|nr:hypothetical protein [Candidatus Pacearchaeota archaeon]
MGFKQLEDEDMMLFLIEFTEELVKNSVKDEKLKEIIEAERIRRKYIEPEKNKPYEEFGKSIVFNEKEEVIKKSAPVIKPPMSKPQINQLKKVPVKKIIIPEIRKPEINRIKEIIPILEHKPVFPLVSETAVVDSSDPLSKINFLIKDKGVQLIECPGAGRNILVKARNKINVTKITLSESEIERIVNYFSEKARIPIIGGILRAAVDDMMIFAVSSQHAGSRFIVTKKSPYQLLEK